MSTRKSATYQEKIMKTIRVGKRIAVLGMMVLIVGLFGNKGMAREQGPYITGLPELTGEELAWQDKHVKKVKKVKLNKIALERINQWRKKQGRPPVGKDRHPVSQPGGELEVMTGTAGSADTTSSLPQEDVPVHVDNSSLKFFPPIRSQGSLNSCGVFNGVYYAMTHMYAMAHDLDAKNGGDGTRLSPKWVYNMVNGGTNSGSWYYWAYEIGQQHGAATWADFPYDGDYRAWNLNPEVWEDALYRRFDQYGYVMDTHTDTGIEQVKQMLLNGYVLNIPTYIYSWNWQPISDDPSTPDDDVFAGTNCVAWVNGTEGYHAMTVVGYNDDIWVDINGNSQIDAGEKGAFRIANSWGTGWGEGGFAWMSYDALKNPSAVTGGPSSNRIYGWYPSRAHWVTARTGYAPKLIGKFTLNHVKRDHLRMSLGVSGIDKTSPSDIWIPEMIYNQGGAYGFDGTTTAIDAGFVFDFSDILPSGGGLYTFYLGLQDDTAGDEAVLKAFTLIDVSNGYVQTQSPGLPLTGDNAQYYATVDYDFFDGNFAPAAVVYASVISGQVPLQVSFDGSASSDMDGTIVSYHWDFGDGASQTGALVEHLYDLPGMYTATLTVTDDLGATDSAGVSIEVLADASKTVYISDMQPSLASNPAGKTAKVLVQVSDLDGYPMADAQVLGTWSGLVSGDVSGTTLGDGTVEFTSKKTRESGNITFTIASVAVSGYTYDAAYNTLSSISISTSETSNQAPEAAISATPVSGTAPLEVLFDGSDSHDADGSIVSYEWDLGDGTTAFSTDLTHWYEEPGTYEVTLTVTDDQGAIDTDTVSITAASGVEIPMHVADIMMGIDQRGVNVSAFAKVTVVDDSNVPVQNASVSGKWSGLVSENQTGYTDADGQVVFTSQRTKSSGTFVFEVTNLHVAGYIYTPENNVETSDAIDTP